ncbi:MAG: histidine phosphatase family protein [Candidatus Phaeomarinobacter sp.]
MQSRAELILIRHAPVTKQGYLFGRTDVEARIDPDAIGRLRARLGPMTRVVSSPALRCRQTAEALFGGHTQDARLWEQDFGDHDGLPFDDLPDIGILDNLTLAEHASPNGESFADVCVRAGPALVEFGIAAHHEGTIALVVHAGVIRAALALVIGHVPGAQAFELATLSVTRLGCGPNGPWSAIEVNRT